MRRRRPASTLFPYTTLFRSEAVLLAVEDCAVDLFEALHERPERDACLLQLGLVPADVRDLGVGVGAPRNRQRAGLRSEEHTSELQSRLHLVCRLLLEKKKTP